MIKLKKILDDNNVRYFISNYVGYESVVIKKNKYQLEIFKDDKGYVSDLQKIPYTWGRMGSTDLEYIIKDLKEYLKIDITNLQLSLF